MATGSEVIDKLVDFMDRLWSMVLEVELDEPNDILEQMQHVGISMLQWVQDFNSFLECCLKVWVLRFYRGDHFDEEAYREIFRNQSAGSLQH